MELILGDCLEKMKEMESGSIDCAVTSPPYWALRDYRVEGQLGLEPTFQEYITKLCDIFDEVKRVLKDEGTCWVNIGDTYSGTGSKKDAKDPKYAEGRNGQVVALNNKTSVPGKSLCCIPDRFKIEMINRGWICRNEIIWHKPNCMPSSAKDRFTVDYEKVFFFVKQKKYFFKTQYEPSSESNEKVMARTKSHYNFNKNDITGGISFDSKNKYYSKIASGEIPVGRNKRCVWQVTTKPFKEAHFATYPEKLIEPMIDAGCPVGGVVLDMFMGSGTTGVVAKKQKKEFVGIELNPEYMKIAEARINNTQESLL